GLSLASGETMDQVYDCLCVLEQEYIRYIEYIKYMKYTKYI
ncbi:type III secretion system protein PrgN, partial [Enterococcus faecium]|nr:type III secretion system protein PrgN [Enterococcus faecium]